MPFVRNILSLHLPLLTISTSQPSAVAGEDLPVDGVDGPVRDGDHRPSRSVQGSDPPVVEPADVRQRPRALEAGQEGRVLEDAEAALLAAEQDGELHR